MQKAAIGLGLTLLAGCATDGRYDRVECDQAAYERIFGNPTTYFYNSCERAAQEPVALAGWGEPLPGEIRYCWAKERWHYTTQVKPADTFIIIAQQNSDGLWGQAGAKHYNPPDGQIIVYDDTGEEVPDIVFLACARQPATCTTDRDFACLGPEP